MSNNDSPLSQPEAARARTASAVVRTSRYGRLRMPRVGAWSFLVLWWGKLRRQVEGRLRKGYIVRRHAKRKGECVRCGACCMLGIACPSLKFDAGGLSACMKYGPGRNVACRIFPYTEADLRERDLILPGTPCGYSFQRAPAQKSS
jgi:hypothetical protein